VASRKPANDVDVTVITAGFEVDAVLALARGRGHKGVAGHRGFVSGVIRMLLSASR